MVYFGLMATFRKILHRSLAGFMAAWLSGIVFLFCCPDMKAAVEADSCPLMKMSSSHCDKAATQKNTNDAIEGIKPACFDCCAFLPVVFDKSRKIDVVQKQIVTPSEKVVASKFDFPVISAASFFAAAFKQRVPDRRGTYLVNGVFRI